MADYERRLRFLRDNFLACRKFYGDPGVFNEAIRILKRAVKKSDPSLVPDLLHVEVELVLAVVVKKLHPEFGIAPGLEQTRSLPVITEALTKLKPFRGRPRDDVFQYHLEAVMALVQEMWGVPVLVSTKKDNRYVPQATNSAGDRVISFFHEVEPAITRTAIVNAVLAARPKYAKKSMTFSRYFPVHGDVKITFQGQDSAESEVRAS